MSNYRSDPTANAAIGAVDRELKQMRKRAEQIRARHRKGLLTRQEELNARMQFTGIFRHLLREAVED